MHIVKRAKEMTCFDYLLIHVHLYNVLAKNMIPAINEKYATATVSLVRWSSDSVTSEKLIKIKERVALPIRIYAGHPLSLGSSTSSARPQVACYLDRTSYRR
ncbi:PREDICTED: uncharacterized protein LOC108694737 isoform X2 [Atta colombica]|uniref:uncharacterized protein LOC108694737 isoform X2 n=1 Tax=Atta colombica TaxID=520822 RepID=UPI00084CCD5B|nr:PREDICTED: uncharacterized protein LOC108694737 isoform X2 [Atta colombica]